MIAVIFEASPSAEGKDEYFELAGALKSQLVEIDGFISVERFQSLTDPDRLLSLSFWRDEDSVQRWRKVQTHRDAQLKGKQSIFNDYRIRVAQVLRDYGLNNRTEAPNHGD